MTARDYSDFASPLPHPGAHLREDYLPGYKLTAGALARAMGLKDRTRIERLVRNATGHARYRAPARQGVWHLDVAL